MSVQISQRRKETPKHTLFLVLDHTHSVCYQATMTSLSQLVCVCVSKGQIEAGTL